MRVITGSAKGRNLLSPEGKDVRPTSEVTKEAIFSIVNFELEEAFVLDLFAGSGQLGIEALSRGAKFCVFVDISRDSQELVRKNLATTGLSQKSRVVAMDYLSFLAGSSDKFDIVLLDPPYAKEMIEKALPLIAAKMNENGAIICETDKRDDLPESAGDFKIFKEYRYGKAKLTVYRRGEINE